MEQRIYIKDLKNHIGKEVMIAGWVDTRRDHGKLIFIDIRDATGIVQTVALPSHKEAHEAAELLRGEWVVAIDGKVNKRPEKMINSDIPNGNLEIEIMAVNIISEAKTPPFDVTTDGHEVGEEQRLIYRYLDLRRPRMQENLKMRHKVTQLLRNSLSEKDFIEIETPILSKSTPEGARDYIVPSRLDKGKFYALPQSPQQYKQLLMVSGIGKYFQVARCMRDEDTRGDRQPEFTQLDIEIAFATQEQILELVENLYTDVVKKLYPNKIILETPWPRLSYKDVMEKYGNDKPDLRKDKNNPDELAFAWITDFPLFEPASTEGSLSPSHHMFTAPKEEDVAKLDTDPHSVRSYQYDLVLNGYEIGGGSIRIHNPLLQAKIFDLIGFDDKQKEQFKHLLTAFTYGVPPHGGIACGLDRFFMILQNEPSIREVIAFPKTGEGRDLMMNAPSEVDEEQLKELGIKVTKKE